MGTIIVGLLVAAAFIYAVYTMRKDRKKGKNCCGDCSQCKGVCK